MRTSLRWFLALLVAGCSDSSDPGDPPQFSVTPTSQWSGGEVTIRSSLFSGRAFIPSMTAGGEPIYYITRIDDTTVVAILPVLSTQSAAIKVRDGASEYDVGSVEIAGFRTRTAAIPGFLWEPVTVQGAGGPAVLGGLFNQPAAGAIGIVDLRSAQTRIESGVQPPAWASGHGAGVSHDPDHVILRDSAGVVAEWQFEPSLALADTVPNVPFSRSVARLSAGVWLFTSNHTTVVRRAGAPDISIQIEDPWGFHLSTTADRAVLNSVLSGTSGAPVFQMSTGDTLYRLPIFKVSGAAFSADGSILYALGDNGTGLDQLWSFNAATGIPIDAHVVTFGFTASGVALSETSSYAFVGAMEDSIPHVMVYSTAGDTLNLLGTMAAPVTSACSSCGSNLLFQAAIMVDDATGTIFLVSQGEPALIWEFDMLSGLPAPPVRRR